MWHGAQRLLWEYMLRRKSSVQSVSREPVTTWNFVSFIGIALWSKKALISVFFISICQWVGLKQPGPIHGFETGWWACQRSQVHTVVFKYMHPTCLNPHKNISTIAWNSPMWPGSQVQSVSLHKADTPFPLPPILDDPCSIIRRPISWLSHSRVGTVTVPVLLFLFVLTVVCRR